MMNDKPLEPPVDIAGPDGIRSVATVQEAKRLLADTSWPVRGPRHEDAVDSCLKVMDGHRSASDARRAFADAAREAGILVGNQDR
jgi:hypothetical protein